MACALFSRVVPLTYLPNQLSKLQGLPLYEVYRSYLMTGLMQLRGNSESAATSLNMIVSADASPPSAR